MSNNRSFLLYAIAIVWLGLASAAPAVAQSCGQVLVSGYYSNVHVFDACSGESQQVLDQAQPRRLSGAQAIALHLGKLYVVSEGSGEILRYDARTLAFVDRFVAAGDIGPTGVAIGPDGDVYVGGYQSSSVLRFDGTSGALKGTVVSANAAGLRGADNGLSFGPDGKLYVPGYDSNNVVRYDPSTGQTTQWVAPGLGGLRHTRAILFEPGGESALVASEGSGTVLRFRVSDGALLGTVLRPGFRPTGLTYGPDGELWVTGDQVNRVAAYRDGQYLRDVVRDGLGGLDGATFVLYLPPAASTAVNPDHIGSQYWIVGVASRQGDAWVAQASFSASGTGFGDAFQTEQLQTRRWGELRLRFTDCDSAEFNWISEGEDSGGFGRGGYAVLRLADNPAGQACRQQGFATQSGADYIQGTWFGGPGRSGEGLFIDRLGPDQALIAFFTHRPVSDSP
ncbi:hypothetical protein [Pseudomarimonas arenosa]|uniref:Virginiamycin B lyase n=1 Tax=Pseudomarimonas arenosa TaxID=2774145 RepID=A0AAW3ZQC9_9GAMM|nr:hypothetical protein [Pseudomarimonas arenosa]MBD8526844.1 hypothetical protein [Pseudomarimonas arenosa]